jgi:hypothetical protein
VTRSRLAASALVAALLLAGCGNDARPATVPAALATSPAPTTTSPSPSPTATPTPTQKPTMTRKEACQQVVEGATDWIYLMARVAADPALESIDPSELEDVSMKIRETLPYLKETTAEKARELTVPLDLLHGVMTTGENTDVNLEDAREAIPDIFKGCRGLANLKGYDSPYDN